MNAAETIAQAPTPFEHGGQTYQLAVADYELELYLQARHEAWARNRIEATAGMVSEQSHRADLEVFASQRAGNRFAFGTPLSLSWLCSVEGMVEYLILLAQKGRKERGGAAWTKDELRRLSKEDAPAWERLFRLVLGRDFPNLLAPAGPGPATQPHTTNGSSVSSAESPGASPEKRSSGSPALTSS